MAVCEGFVHARMDDREAYGCGLIHCITSSPAGFTGKSALVAFYLEEALHYRSTVPLRQDTKKAWFH